MHLLHCQACTSSPEPDSASHEWDLLGPAHSHCALLPPLPHLTLNWQCPCDHCHQQCVFTLKHVFNESPARRSAPWWALFPQQSLQLTSLGILIWKALGREASGPSGAKLLQMSQPLPGAEALLGWGLEVAVQERQNATASSCPSCTPLPPCPLLPPQMKVSPACTVPNQRGNRDPIL